MKNEIVETCPHCEKEIVLEWDVEKDGYEIRCPYCGKKVMLCNECQVCTTCASCDWNSLTNTCHKSKDHHTEYTPRRVIVDFDIDDEFALKEGVGTLDYLCSLLEMLTADGVSIRGSKILDEDDAEDETVIELTNAIFNM